MGIAHVDALCAILFEKLKILQKMYGSFAHFPQSNLQKVLKLHRILSFQPVNTQSGMKGYRRCWQIHSLTRTLTS